MAQKGGTLLVSLESLKAPQKKPHKKGVGGVPSLKPTDAVFSGRHSQVREEEAAPGLPLGVNECRAAGSDRDRRDRISAEEVDSIQ